MNVVFLEVWAGLAPAILSLEV